MPTPRIPNYLLTNRKRWALSQEELAVLLGEHSASAVSRYETGERQPSGQVMLACEVIFGVPARYLFPRLYNEIEDVTMSRAESLSRVLDAVATPSAKVKRRLLKTMIDRAAASSEIV